MDQGRQRNKILNSIGICILFAIGIFARTHVSDITSDMHDFLLPWYDYIQSKGILRAMGNNFSNYTPPYTYLLALMTLTSSFIPKAVAIKVISICADFVNAFLVYKIVRLKYPYDLAPLWAAGAFLCLPTILINSAFWGQADAVYMVFLLASLYFFLKEKSVWGMLTFSISFTFKAQAVFLLPFLIVLFLKRQIKIADFLLVPIVYSVLCLPVVLLGRGWVDVLTIYLIQGQTYHWLSANAPNLYIFVSNSYYRAGIIIGLIVTLIGTGTWVALTVLRKKSFSQERLPLIALVSVALLPFLLPKMHDRYFYARPEMAWKAIGMNHNSGKKKAITSENTSEA